MTNRILMLAVCAAAIPSPAYADDFQQWAQIGAKIDLSDRVVLSEELVARFSGDKDGLYELENSLLLGYKLSNTTTAWAGYVHNPNYAAGSFTVIERRAREQITFDNFTKLGTGSLSARVRIEQRWRDGVEGTAWRLRPYLKVGVPLGSKTSPTLNLTAEPFINLNTTPFQAVDGFERLRSAVTLSFPLSNTVKLEGGYLNQHRFVRSGPDTDDHVLTASLGLSF